MDLAGLDKKVKAVAPTFTFLLYLKGKIAIFD